MQRHYENRDRQRHFDDDTEWGQPRSRAGLGKLRRIRHEPYRREPNGDRRSWFDEADDTD